MKPRPAALWFVLTLLSLRVQRTAADSSPKSATSPQLDPATQPSPSPERAESREGTTYQTTVRATKAPRSTSDFTIERDVLRAAPRQTAADLLSTAPGVYIAKPEGDAVAHQVFLRGFDAEHGQDIEFTVGDIPINLPSHIHGQGYADLNFLIPEAVRQLRVTEGVYDPRQGDFAVAGSVDFDLGVSERGFLSTTSYGSFNTVRQLLLWAPRGQAEETFVGATIKSTDGFGNNRGSLTGSTLGQFAFGSGSLRGLIHFAAAGARANLAGVLRRGDYESGRVDIYDSYNDPSANAQSALSIRSQLGFSLDHRSTQGARTHVALWLLWSGFRLRENFTGYIQRSVQKPDWVGRGDLIEQENRDLSFGMKSWHRTRRFEPTTWLSGNFEAGVSARLDLIDQGQNLLQAPENQTWDRRVDASVRGADIGIYGDLDWRASRYFRLRGGMRADVLYYDVDDRLGNFIPSFMRQSYFVGFRRTALGVAWGPRATAEFTPWRWLTWMLAYGDGYRSPQARQLSEGENAPYTKVRSIEGGFKLRFFSDRVQLTGAGYATFLSSDLAFDPQEGRPEKIGPTSRTGLVSYLLARPLDGLLAAVSVTYVHATLDAPPPATPANPVPAYTPGQLLPYVPPVVVRLDLSGKRDVFRMRDHAVSLSAGLGLSYLSARPLPYGQAADPVTVLDLQGAVRWWFLELGVQAYNAAGTRYAALEYSFVSNWRSRPIPSLIPTRHFVAGAPRTVLGSLSFHF